MWNWSQVKATEPHQCESALVQAMAWNCQATGYYYLSRSWSIFMSPYDINTLRPRQNGPHFPEDIFKCISLNEKVWISINISMKFVSKGQINNILGLVHIMACCLVGTKQLSEPMTVRLPMHICITWPQWVIRSQWVNMDEWFGCPDIHLFYRNMTERMMHPTDTLVCHKHSSSGT